MTIDGSRAVFRVAALSVLRFGPREGAEVDVELLRGDCSTVQSDTFRFSSDEVLTIFGDGFGSSNTDEAMRSVTGAASSPVPIDACPTSR
jgi:hypothetical protein